MCVERRGRVERAEGIEAVGGDGRERNGRMSEADADGIDSGETVRGTGGVSMSVNRPKRGSRGRPLYDQTTRRRTTRRAGGRAEGRIRWGREQP